MDKTPVKGGRWRTHSCALERERIASLRIEKCLQIDRPAFSIKPLAEYLSPVLIGTKLQFA